jgi:hypothetical protein
LQEKSRNDSASFHDADVAINRQISEPFHPGVGGGPANLELVHPGVGADAEHHARVMTGEKAAASQFESGTLQVSGRPGYARAYRINIGLLSRPSAL